MVNFLLGMILSVAAVTSFAANTDTPTEQEAPADYGVNTLYSLLVAEIAGQRQLFDLALGNYLLEAHRTQDAGVAARATQIAQYIGADQAALDASTLWVKLAPNDPLAHQALSLELVKASRFSESNLHLQKAIDLDPAINVNFIVQQGSVMSEGAREQWLEHLTDLLARNKHHATLLFNIASLHQQQQDNEAALSLINELIAQHKDSYEGWTLKARLHATQGDIDTALKATNAALKEFKNDKAFNILKARLLIKQKDVKQASEVFAQIVKDHPKEGHIILPLALTQLELGELEAAKQSLNSLLRLQQLTDEAHYYLGRIAQQQDQWDQALTHFKTMTGGREYLAAQSAIVQTYLKNQDATAAINHIQQQRINDPDNQQAYFLMEVEILNRTEQYEASLQVLNNALTAYADNTDLRYSRAMVSEKLGDLSLLEKDLGYIIDKEPENATALNALGYTLADHSARLDEALVLIEKARALSPHDPAILDSLGWVYFRIGRTQEALEILNQAYQVFPDAEVAAHLGEVLWSLGQHKQAKLIWQQGLESKPNSEIILETLTRLKVEL